MEWTSGEGNELVGLVYLVPLGFLDTLAYLVVLALLVLLDPTSFACSSVGVSIFLPFTLSLLNAVSPLTS